jgi:hypothetical protein
MNWARGTDPYHLVSHCGRYTVCRAASANVVTYQAWRKAQPVAQLLGTFLNEFDAKACAAKHAGGSQ